MSVKRIHFKTKLITLLAVREVSYQAFGCFSYFSGLNNSNFNGQFSLADKVINNLIHFIALMKAI